MILYHYFFPAAFAALTEKLQEMAANFKIRFLREFAFNFFQSAISKINDFPAVRANKMMVMFGWAAHQITPATASGVYFTDKAEFSQDFKRPVNSYQPYTGVFTNNTLVDGRRGQVFTVIDDGADNGAALRGNFIAVPAECAFYLLFRIDHFLIHN
jgi:hypothetical protein